MEKPLTSEKIQADLKQGLKQHQEKQAANAQVIEQAVLRATNAFIKKFVKILISSGKGESIGLEFIIEDYYPGRDVIGLEYFNYLVQTTIKSLLLEAGIPELIFSLIEVQQSQSKFRFRYHPFKELKNQVQSTNEHEEKNNGS